MRTVQRRRGRQSGLGRQSGRGRPDRTREQGRRRTRAWAATLGATAAVVALMLAGCEGDPTAPPVGESGLTWITVPPQQGGNGALLQDVRVIDVEGCLAVVDAEGAEAPIYPVFSSDDPFPVTLEVGDRVSLGGSEADLDEVGDMDMLIPPACAGAQRVWFAAPQN